MSERTMAEYRSLQKERANRLTDEYLAGTSVQDIAKAEGIKPSTVYNVIKRIRVERGLTPPRQARVIRTAEDVLAELNKV